MQTTMREANDRGYDCLLATDATESYFPAFKAAAIEMICAQGAHRRLGGTDRCHSGGAQWLTPPHSARSCPTHGGT